MPHRNLTLTALALLVACGGSTKVSDKAPDSGTPQFTAPGSTSGGTPTLGGVPGPLDLLTDEWHGGLRVEIDYVAGSGPDPEALDRVNAALAELVAGGQITKPSGIELVLDDELPAGDPDAVHTFGDLTDVIEANRGPHEDGDFVVIHALYTDGHYEQDGQGGGVILGFAYGANNLVMMHDNIQRACDNVLAGPLGLGMGESLCEAAEGTVLMHEIGHLFGLVNNGLPMVADHQDTDHGRHDTDEDCLMYFAAERDSMVEGIAGAAGIGGPQIKSFDAACKADMAAVQ